MFLKRLDEFWCVQSVETDGLAITTGDVALTVTDRHDGRTLAHPYHLILNTGLRVPDTQRLIGGQNNR